MGADGGRDLIDGLTPDGATAERHSDRWTAGKNKTDKMRQRAVLQLSSVTRWSGQVSPRGGLVF